MSQKTAGENRDRAEKASGTTAPGRRSGTGPLVPGLSRHPQEDALPGRNYGERSYLTGEPIAEVQEKEAPGGGYADNIISACPQAGVSAVRGDL